MALKNQSIKNQWMTLDFAANEVNFGKLKKKKTYCFETPR